MLPPPLPDAGFSVIRVFGALALVVALFLAGVWIFKNWHRIGGHRGRTQHLQVLESRSLGGRHALYVVGYQGQRLLVAASPSGVSLLSHLPVAEIEPSAGADKGGNQNFVHALQQALQQKA
jgi:flagellar protein FliO/FliZ